VRAPVAVVAALLLAATARLPGLGARSLASAEQAGFVESQGFSTRVAVPAGRPVVPQTLPRHSGITAIARGATVPPIYATSLALWARLAGSSEIALRLPSAVAGVLAAALAALVAAEIAGPGAAAWAGGLVALSPIHTLASRAAGPEAPLVLVLLLALALVARIESSGSRSRAAALGLAAAVLAVSGVAAFAAVALVPLAWLALRADRRPAAGLAAAVAVASATVAGLLGLARSPLDYGEIPTWVPETTASGIARCAGASFTRVLGLEYQLAVSHARQVVPVTAIFVALILWGVARLPARPRGLLVAGAVLPFALGATLALATGRVTPLQAGRLVAALPFLALLVAQGLASLRGWRAGASGAVVGAATVAFLWLTLAGPDGETSPTRAVARRVAGCRAEGTVVAVQRPLDLLALAAWDVPGPFVLRTVRGPLPDGPAIVVGLSTTCVSGGASCGAFPACPID
jgi:4-amino-4-deoxy-L-arabinose transferase-like glycosyltransferase